MNCFLFTSFLHYDFSYPMTTVSNLDQTFRLKQCQLTTITVQCTSMRIYVYSGVFIHSSKIIGTVFIRVYHQVIYTCGMLMWSVK